MSLSIRVAVVTGLLLGGLCAAPASAEDQKSGQKVALETMKGHVQAATTAFGEKNFQKMKSELDAALTVGKGNALTTNALMAKAYVLYGVLEVTGNKNSKEGIAHFVKALEISPAVQVPVNMTSKPVRTAFAKAEDQDASTTASSEKDAAANSTAAAQPINAPAAPTDTKVEDKTAQAKVPPTPQTKAETPKPEVAKADDKAVRAEAARVELARAEAEKAEKGRLDKQVAAAQEAEKKEREAKEKLAREKQELEKQLVDAKARLQQLEKEKGDKDKQLVSLSDSEKKERDAREKAEKARQELEARDKDRTAREGADRQQRARLAEGPALPATVSEPIHCTVPDEIQADTELFVHCVPRSNLTARALVFYFRPGGNAVLYNALVMEKSKKGWFTTAIPASRVTGKLLHYYVEARDERQAVTASNGKAGSPNVATVRTGAPLAGATSAPAPTAAPAAVAKKTPPSRSARRARTKERPPAR